MTAINLYNNYNTIDERTDEQKILQYFDSLFGDNITLLKVLSFESLDEYCEYNNYSKDFIIETIKNRLK